MQAHGTLAVGGIQLYDNPVGQAADGRRDTAGSRQVDFTVFGHFACLDDGDVYFSHETVAHFLSHLREVDVVVGYLTVVHGFAEIHVGSVGGTVTDSFSA